MLMYPSLRNNFDYQVRRNIYILTKYVAELVTVNGG